MASKLVPTNEYRCTRESCYGPGTVGYKDKTARQGHYIDADNEQEAFEIMRQRYPREAHFTVDFHKKSTRYVSA